MIYIDKLSMEPTKWLIVEVMPKDIEFHDAILEFIDNSVSAANKLTNDGNLTGYDIYIYIKRDSFTISDNCGGISEEEVNNDAFKLGHPNNSKSKEGQQSRYGIGMKRSFFKLGKYVHIVSSTDNFQFEIKLDVDDWMQQEGWDINIQKSRKKKNLYSGTTIEISKFKDDTKKAFAKKGFVISIEDKVREKYLNPINRGLKIVINNAILQALPDEDMELIATEKINNKYFTGAVTIKKAPYNKARAGWNIRFNDTFIKTADKSSISGWGCTTLKDDIFSVKFEEKYSRFRGFIELNDKGTGSLPYNTSKSDIDTSSEVYTIIRDIIINITAKTIRNFEEDLRIITYKKPAKEVEYLKNYLKVNSNKEVGEKTYQEFIDNHNIKF